MKKRLLAMLLAALMVVSVFAGCSQKPNVPETKGPETTATENTGSTGPAELQKFDDVKLDYLLCWNFALPLPKDQYNTDVAKAIRDKIGVTINVETIAMPETEKLNMMFASNDMPDILNAPYFGGTDPHTLIIKKAATEGRLLDISDKIDKYENLKHAFDVGVISRKFKENDVEDPVFEGAKYVLPWQVPADAENETFWGNGVFARADVLKELGVDPASIKTSEQLFDVMMKAKDHGFKDVNGNDAITASVYANGFMIGGFGASLGVSKLTGFDLDENGNITSGLLGEGFIDSNMFIWKMVNSGILDVECFHHSVNQANEKLGNGKVLFTASQYAIPINATKATGLYDSHPEMRWVPVGPLNDKEGNPMVQLRSEGRTGSPGFMFPTSCKNLDAALTWLDYINSTEGRILTMYGFEGDTFEFNEDGQPRMNKAAIDAFKADPNAWTDACVARGFGGSSVFGWSLVVDNSRTKFGETGPFGADNADPDLEAYRKMVPIKTIKGYPINALRFADFERYDEVLEVTDADEKRKVCEAAYFAKTEEEARELLKEYQESVRTGNDGVYLEFLEWLTEQSKTRDDFVY